MKSKIKFYSYLIKALFMKSKNTKWTILTAALIITLTALVMAVSPNVERAYDNAVNHFDPYDIHVKGITEEKAIMGMEKAERAGAICVSYETHPVTVYIEDVKRQIRLTGIGENFLEMRQYELVEGTLPLNEREILMDIGFRENSQYQMGDSVRLLIENFQTREMEAVEYLICGWVRIPNNTDKAAYKAYTTISDIQALWPESSGKCHLYIRTSAESLEELIEFSSSMMLREQFSDFKLNEDRINLKAERSNSSFMILFRGLGVFIALISSVLLFNLFQIGKEDRIRQIGLVKSIGLTGKQLVIFQMVELLLYLIISTLLAAVLFCGLEMLFGKMIQRAFTEPFLAGVIDLTWEFDFWTLAKSGLLIGVVMTVVYSGIAVQFLKLSSIKAINYREDRIRPGIVGRKKITGLKMIGKRQTTRLD